MQQLTLASKREEKGKNEEERIHGEESLPEGRGKKMGETNKEEMDFMESTTNLPGQ